MIQGNQTWQLALAQPQKQAYYTVEIPDFAIAIAVPSQLARAAEEQNVTITERK